MIENPIGKYDAIIVAVGHQEYKKLTKSQLKELAKDELLLFDIKGVKSQNDGDFYWKL